MTDWSNCKATCFNNLNQCPGAEFLMRHIKGEPKCYFMVTRDGKPVKVQRTIFTECFYVMAMAAMHRATSKQHFRVNDRSLFNAHSQATEEYVVDRDVNNA